MPASSYQKMLRTLRFCRLVLVLGSSAVFEHEDDDRTRTSAGLHFRIRLLDRVATASHRFPVSRHLARDQYGFEGIISHASSVVTVAGPPFENNLTPTLSARDG